VSLIALSRPRHWVKNALVLMPVPFAVKSGAHLDWKVFALGLGGFCLLNSGVYALNDSLDAEADRRHPDKRGRPVASGAIGVGGARLWSLVLVAAALALAWSTRRAHVPTLFLVYLAANLVYSMRGRQVPLVDVFLLSSGYVIRVLLGCALVEARASNWLLLCTSTLALFLALAKRRAELALLGDEAAGHRAALQQYTVAQVDRWLTALVGATIVSYALYTQSPRTVEHFGTTNLLYTLPFVVYALFRYQQLVARDGSGGDPGLLLARNPGLLIALVGWAATAAFIIYR